MKSNGSSLSSYLFLISFVLFLVLSLLFARNSPPPLRSSATFLGSAGRIPVEIGSLTALQQLSVTRTRLSGAVVIQCSLCERRGADSIKLPANVKCFVCMEVYLKMCLHLVFAITFANRLDSCVHWASHQPDSSQLVSYTVDRCVIACPHELNV